MVAGDWLEIHMEIKILNSDTNLMIGLSFQSFSAF